MRSGMDLIGLGDRVLVDEGGVGTGLGGNGPFCSPTGERALAGNGFAVCSRLDLVEGGTGGDAARGQGFEAGRRVCGAIQNRWGPHCREPHIGVPGDEGGKGGVEEEALTLVGEAARVGDRGKSRKTATEKINV